MTNRFQVNLSGLVEVLSRNLYSGPKVFVRELLQNGFDAITARQKLDPTCPALITFTAFGGRRLVVTDSGVGLTLAQTQELLASIGSTSKRDELGMQRAEFIGQFGIGLLSCFMVTQTIVVYSQSAAEPDSPVVCWEGRGDGTWDVRALSEGDVPDSFIGPGTMIVLEAQGLEPLFTASALKNLVSEYGAHLPVSILISEGDSQAQLGAVAFPWELDQNAQDKWCSENFGFHPFDRIPIEIAGTRGLAFVLPEGAHPGQSLKHHVYVHNMLVSKAETNLVPDWAYFVRVVVDSTALKPTASRESLFDDDLLDEVRQGIGSLVRTWLTELANSNQEKFVKFMRTHLVGMKALAVHDRQTRDMMKASVPYETTLGFFTLDEIIERTGGLVYSRTTDDFRAIEAIAAAQSILVLNGGYAFDEQMWAQIKLDQPELDIREIRPAEILNALQPLPVMDEINYLAFLEHASQALQSQKVEVVIRNFEPATVPMVYLPQPGSAGKEIQRKVAESATGAFADVLSSMSGVAPAAPRSQVVFNAQSAIINQLSTVADPEILELAVRGFYVQAIINGHHPQTPEVKQWSTFVFTEMIRRSLNGFS